MRLPSPASADDPLAPLLARVARADARATDWLALGRALHARAGGAIDGMRAALLALTRAAQLDPFVDPKLMHELAQTAFVTREWPLAEASCAVLLKRDPHDVNALVWRSAAAQARNDFAAAEQLLRAAARIVPNHPVVLHKLALCVKEQTRFAEGEALLREVLALKPESSHARFDLSELEMRSGRYAQGWEHYEARLELEGDGNGARTALASIGAPWRGESLAGRTLVVYGEQGNGDCLWAFRFLAPLAERARREGGRVVLGYAGPMRHLFERMLPPDVALEAALITHPDYHCGLMSLPLRLGVFDPAGWGAPYLRADPARVQTWRARVAQATPAGARSVALVWNGNPAHVRDARRSIPDAELGALLSVPGVTFFALSPGRGAAVEAWRARGANFVDPTGQFDAGFDDVAALIASVDHVVTIDSGPAHLAGALGAPTSLLIDRVSAWFWGSEMARTPWYDSIELFRQPAVGDWGPALARVRARLEALAAS
ncbi:ADP-heptose--LPS heptosyltransferase [Paraburkholderia silviterrae]|uniref:ADP-heptose--LPS heptosyltransferase n=1 Tax=Paraburkholderia silviterrae TaxID=2528715 RepID=A0A4R5MBI0_9BURK|nr:ADP-heptose--LPS heptosyltransferase [Paraburkholderia silviterrae]